MAVEPDSAGVHFPPPFIHLGALLLRVGGRAFRRAPGSFDIDWRLIVVNAALNPCRSERALTISSPVRPTATVDVAVGVPESGDHCPELMAFCSEISRGQRVEIERMNAIDERLSARIGSAQR